MIGFDVPSPASMYTAKRSELLTNYFAVSTSNWFALTMVVNWSAQNRHWGPARHQELVGIANVILNVGSCEWKTLCLSILPFPFFLQFLPANANCSKSKRIWQISGWSFSMLKARSLNYTRREKALRAYVSWQLPVPSVVELKECQRVTHISLRNLFTPFRTWQLKHIAILSFRSRRTATKHRKTHPSCLDDSD